MEYPAHHLLFQVPQAQPYACQAHRDVVPAQAKSFAHQARRNEYAERHRRQQQRGQERHHGRGPAEQTPGIQDMVERVGSPSQLPGAKIVLPGLLVQVRENQEEQESYHGRYYDHTDRDAVHGAMTATSARGMKCF